MKLTLAAEWWAFGCVAVDIFSSEGYMPMFPAAEGKTCPQSIKGKLKRKIADNNMRNWLEGYFAQSPENRTGGESTMCMFRNNAECLM